MRARDVFLALAIIVGGVVVTAAHRGVFHDWAQTATNLCELCLPYSNAWAQGDEWREVERFTRESDVSGVTSLLVDNPNGQVVVAGGGQNQVQVAAVRYGVGRTPEEAFPRAQRASLAVARAGGVMKISVTGPQGFWRDSRLDLYISAPAFLSLQVKTTSGLVEVKGIGRSVKATTTSGALTVAGARQVEATTASGSIDVQDASESVSARTVSGQVSVTKVAGRVEVSTVSGEAALEGLRGDLVAHTVSGAIVVQGYGGSETSLDTVSGPVRASIGRALSGRFSARSVSGAITVALPPDSNCEVVLTSRTGHVSSNLPLREVERTRDHLKGLLGRGRGELSLRSTSGSVTVQAARPPEESAHHSEGYQGGIRAAPARHRSARLH